MSYSYCTTEDLKRAKAGQHLYINSRCYDLKREDGTEFPFVAKKR